MRFVLPLLLLAACAAEPQTQPVDDPVLDSPIDEAVHACDVAAEAQFDAGEPWTVQQKDACFSGCETGDTQGFQQGRLACILDDEACPECVADQPDPAYDVGYKSCFADSYVRGYADEGCDTSEL